MGVFLIFCLVAAFSNAELALQGFLYLPHHRFMFHAGLLIKGRSCPFEIVVKSLAFGEIF